MICDCRSFSSIFLPEIQLQSLIHIDNPEAAVVRSRFLRTGQQISQMGQILLFHADSIVRDTDAGILPFLPGADPDLSHFPFVFDSVVEGIFHQRLQGHLNDRHFRQLLRELDAVGENVAVAELLDLQVGFHMGNLLFQGYDIPSSGQASCPPGKAR